MIAKDPCPPKNMIRLKSYILKVVQNFQLVLQLTYKNEEHILEHIIWPRHCGMWFVADNVIAHTLLEGQTMIMRSMCVFAEVLVIYIKAIFHFPPTYPMSLFIY